MHPSSLLLSALVAALLLASSPACAGRRLRGGSAWATSSASSSNGLAAASTAASVDAADDQASASAQASAQASAFSPPAGMNAVQPVQQAASTAWAQAASTRFERQPTTAPFTTVGSAQAFPAIAPQQPTPAFDTTGAAEPAAIASVLSGAAADARSAAPITDSTTRTPSTPSSNTGATPSPTAHTAGMPSSAAMSSPTSTPADTTSGPSAVGSPTAAAANANASAAADANSGTGGCPDITATLAAHNAARARHNAPPLVWSDNLAAFAAGVSATCRMQHSNGPYGENLAQGSNLSTCAAAVAMWMSEETASPPAGSSSGTGHFTQIVWAGTTEVGCALQPSCGFVTCSYAPAGNVQGRYASNVM